MKKFKQTTLWLGLMIAGFILLTIVAATQSWFLTTNGLRTLLALQSLVVFILPTYLAAHFFCPSTSSYFRLNKYPSWKVVLIVVTLMLIAIPGINLLAYWNEQIVFPEFLSNMEQYMKAMEDNLGAQTERMLKVESAGGVLINIIVLALLPALSEELMFRGMGLRLLDDEQNKTMAIWVTAILFSTLHMQFYGFIPRMLMGALFGYFVVWTGSIWTSILAHFVNNSAVVITSFILYRMGIDEDAGNAFGTEETLWVGIASLILTTIGFLAFHYGVTTKKTERTLPTKA